MFMMRIFAAMIFQWLANDIHLFKLHQKWASQPNYKMHSYQRFIHNLFVMLVKCKSMNTEDQTDDNKNKYLINMVLVLWEFITCNRE